MWGINDLLSSSSSSLRHERFITFLPSPIKEYITEEMYFNRYEEVTLKQIVDSMSLEFDKNGNVIPFEYSEHNSNYSDVIKALVRYRFGSAKFDW